MTPESWSIVVNLDPAGLPTPIAKSTTRVLRSAAGREKFEATLLAFEVYVKYFCCVALAGLNRLDHDSCYTIEHELSRNIAIGSWLHSLHKATEALKNIRLHTSIPDWLSNGMNWLNKKRNRAPDEWFTALQESALAAHDLLKRDGDRSEFHFITLTNVLDFLARLRNKTRGHGAKPDSFYRYAEPHVTTIVASFSLHPWCALQLLTKVPGTFRDCLVLRGSTPTQRMPMHSHIAVDPERPMLVNSPTGGHAYLPPLVEYDIDYDRCLFANDAFKSATRQMEFMDYFSGMIDYRGVPHYASDPIPKNRLGNICEFPKSQFSNPTPALTQVHRPRVLDEARSRLATTAWSRMELIEANRGRPPSGSGVYCLVSHVEVAGLEAHRIVGYVGRAQNLSVRFANYLDERNAAHGRQGIRDFLATFPDIVFWYATVDSTQDRARLEDWLIKAIDPPVNGTLRLKGATDGEPEG